MMDEREIAFRLAMLASSSPEPPKDLEQNIRALEFAQGFSYAPLQRKAMETALSSNIMVLTGGPGTGKTTAINAILALLENGYDRVALCAPTGRAAKRLSEVTGHKASTIHRLLEVDYSSGEVRFVHNEKNRLKVDVVILQNIFFGVLSFIPFIAMVGGFEYAYQKKANEQNERTIQFRKRFYKVSAWLGTYFPVRLLVSALVHFYPRPINSLALECVIAVLYLMTATFITLEIEKRHLSKN